MDVVEASHLQKIKEHLEVNPDFVFKMRKFDGKWFVGVVYIYDDGEFAAMSDSSFVGALKQLSEFLNQVPS